MSVVTSHWRLGHTRVHRPWVTEPGLWLQYDFGDGPMVVRWCCRWRGWRGETERPHLHAIPELPHTAGLGVTRKVPDNTPMITIDHCQYANPLVRQHF